MKKGKVIIRRRKFSEEFKRELVREYERDKNRKRQMIVGFIGKLFLVNSER